MQLKNAVDQIGELKDENKEIKGQLAQCKVDNMKLEDMFRTFQLVIENQMNELRKENAELKFKVMKNQSPTKGSKTNPKRAQSSDKGYKKGPSTMQVALQKNNVLNNTVTQTSNPKKMSENSKKQ